MGIDLTGDQKKEIIEIYQKESLNLSTEKENEVISLVEKKISEMLLEEVIDKGLTIIIRNILAQEGYVKKPENESIELQAEERLKPHVDKYLRDKGIELEYSKLPKTIVRRGVKCYKAGKFSEEDLNKEVEDWFESKKIPSDKSKSDLAERFQIFLSENKVDYTIEDIRRLVEESSKNWIPGFGYNTQILKNQTKDFIYKKKRATAQIKIEEQQESAKTSELEEAVGRKSRINGLLVGTAISSLFTGVTALILSIIAYDNSKINTNYNEVCKKIEKSVIQTVDTQIESKLDKYTPKSLQEAIYRGQTEGLVNLRNDLTKQQKETSNITNKLANKIKELEKRRDLTPNFEQLSQDQKKSQQNNKSLEQYVNDIAKKINSLKTSDASTTQEIAKLREGYQKCVSDLGKTIEDLEKEFESKGTIIQEKIKEAEAKFKEGLTYLESSLEKYIETHKEEHKPKEVIKPKKEEPVIIIPVPKPDIPEEIMRKLEELKSGK